jgi:hypothetical protein
MEGTMKIQPVIERIASLLTAIQNCQKHGNTEWEQRHRANLDKIVKNYLPSGAGIDNGTYFDMQDSTPNKLVFRTSFHHMNETGYYDGWTEHKVIATPSFMGRFDLKITGKDRNSIKDYLHETFTDALNEPVSLD